MLWYPPGRSVLTLISNWDMTMLQPMCTFTIHFNMLEKVSGIEQALLIDILKAVSTRFSEN